MSTPRDFDVLSRTGRVKAARLYSNIVSPPVMFAILGLLFALYERPNLNGFLWAAVYGFWVSLAPILFVLYLLKTGRIQELHMSDTRERHLPYATAVACALIAFGLISLFDGPELLRCMTLFNTVELAGLGLINIKWLISIHATGIMGHVYPGRAGAGLELGAAGGSPGHQRGGCAPLPQAAYAGAAHRRPGTGCGFRLGDDAVWLFCLRSGLPLNRRAARAGITKSGQDGPARTHPVAGVPLPFPAI